MPEESPNPWIAAIRPRTLPLSVTPVVVGSVLAYVVAGAFRPEVFAAALLAAMLIQVGTNLHNDAADFERGADGPDRLGPKRAVAEGWLAAGLVKRVALRCFLLAFILGIYLAAVGGWPIVVLGLAALAAGWGYTGGPRPIAYSPLGELFVFAFFGLAAVVGTFYLHAGTTAPAAWLAASALGLHAAAVLTVNNYRDLESDRRVGKRTLAVVLGREASRRLYGLLIAAPFVLAAVLAWDGLTGAATVAILLPPARKLVLRFRREPVGPAFNEILAATAKLQMLFGVLLCGGLLWVALG
ncbi:1,4-dihydroxy-2-naphthoate polyprenyltransferase [Endothiovibrio diazotrophicus]